MYSHIVYEASTNYTTMLCQENSVSTGTNANCAEITVFGMESATMAVTSNESLVHKLFRPMRITARQKGVLTDKMFWTTTNTL